MGKSPPSNTAALKLGTIQVLLYLQSSTNYIIHSSVTSRPMFPIDSPDKSAKMGAVEKATLDNCSTILPGANSIVHVLLLGTNSDHVTVVLVSRFNDLAACMPQLVVVWFKWIVVALSPM